MTHRSSGMETARLNNPRHTGIARRIREALRQSSESLSVYGLHLATGLKPKQIRSSISTMICESGSIVSSKGLKGEVRYEIYKPPGKVSEPVAGEEFRIAGRITIPQYRYGGSRLS